MAEQHLPPPSSRRGQAAATRWRGNRNILLPSSRASEASDDADEALSKGQLTSRARRVQWLQVLREISPQLPHPPMPSEVNTLQHFGGLAPKPVKDVMPVCPMFKNELAKTAKHTTVNLDPFKKVIKFYKTSDPFESAVLQPRVVPRKLLQEVSSDKLKNPGASGAEARLKDSSPEGQKEQAALSSHKQACTWLCLVNSQELVVNALQSLHQTMETELNLTSMEAQTPALARATRVLFGALDSAQLAVLDLQNTNLHMSRCATYQYNLASRDSQES